MSNRTLAAAIAAIVVLAVSLVLAVAIPMSRQTPRPTPWLWLWPTPRPTPTPRTLVVYVSGAVANPGTHTVQEGLRVEDAIRLAGGLSEDADPTSVNLAAKLRDGMQVDVKRRSPAGTATPM